tara:strand:+ start:61824 stop:63431 length:1608 start_codon:yes stop_codon:yes gene_type:complete
MKSLMKTTLTIILLALTTMAVADPVAPTPINNFTEDNTINLTANDGVQLDANLFQPIDRGKAAKHPVIIFVNSWGFNKEEYTPQAKIFAADGYIVLSISARGWGKSGGVVDVAGPQDVADVENAIDWVGQHVPNADMNKIGMAGISYGAGITLLTAAQDPRIKAVAAMSGWANLNDSLYGEQSFSTIWGNLLITDGKLKGNLDGSLPQMVKDFEHHENVDTAVQWAQMRSANTHMAGLNRKGLAIDLSNNFEDRIFRSNYMLSFYENLKGPKHMDLNQGMHAAPDFQGMTQPNSLIWQHAHMWFDHYLKGQKSGATQLPSLMMQVRNTKQYESFANWPSTNVHQQQYYLSPRVLIKRGSLQTRPEVIPASNTIKFGKFAGVSSGIPIISMRKQTTKGIPITTNVDLIRPDVAIGYRTPVLKQAEAIRGNPQVTVWVTPKNPQWQLVAYLYDVGPRGKAALISQAPVAHYNDTVGKAIKVTFPLRSVAYNVPAGHQIELALATHDVLYSGVPQTDFSVKIDYGMFKQSRLTLPLEA